MPTKPDPVLDTARDYIAAGIMCIPIHGPDAPVSDPGKQPKDSGWQKHRLTFEEYAARHAPGDNVGVVTGRASGLVCVDCDRKDDPAKNGMAWFQENEARLGQFVLETTGGGGVHLFYRYPQGRDFVPSRGRLFPGVDFMADNGRQVVTWPSRNSKGPYTFRNGMSLLDVQAEAGEPPAWLLEENDKAHQIDQQVLSRQTAAKADPANTDLPYEVDACRAVLAKFPAAVEGEGGDLRTVQAAWVCYDRQLSPEMTLKLLLEVYNLRCLPPWEPKDLARKVRNAFDYAKLPWGNKLTIHLFPDDIEELAASIPTVKEEEEGGGVLTYDPKAPVMSARHFIARRGGKLIATQDHLHQRIQLYLYRDDRKHWDLADDEGLSKFIFDDIRRQAPEVAGVLKPDHLKHIGHFVKLQAPARRGLRPDTWLTKRTGDAVACQNGIVDIATGALSAHTPAWFSHTTLPFDYAPGATCPEFVRFLDRIWDGDRELIRSLQLWVGYILTSRMAAQKFAVFKGQSRGGKGTLCRIIEALVGDGNYAACTLMEFGDKHGLELFLGKRVGIFSDAEDSVLGREGMVAANRIIQVVGNDPVPVNRKNRDMVSMVLPTKIIMTCNLMPPLGNRKNAFTNRMIIFPFWKTFAGREDEGLVDRMRAELPGILNWALEGARAVLAGEKLFQATKAQQTADEVAELLDPLQAFVAEAVVFTNDVRDGQRFVKSKHLYDVYRHYCRESNHKPLAFRRFIQDFKAKAGDRVHAARAPDLSRQKGYYGVALDRDFLSQWDLDSVYPEASVVSRPLTADEVNDADIPF